APMKSVRGHIVLRALENEPRVTIAGYRPDPLEDPDEAFDAGMEVFIRTDLPPEAVAERILGIPDIARVEPSPWDPAQAADGAAGAEALDRGGAGAAGAPAEARAAGGPRAAEVPSGAQEADKPAEADAGAPRGAVPGSPKPETTAAGAPSAPPTRPGPVAESAPGLAPPAPGRTPSAPGRAPSAPGGAPAAPARTPSTRPGQAGRPPAGGQRGAMTQI